MEDSSAKEYEQLQRKTFPWVLAKDHKELKQSGILAPSKRKSSQITATEVAENYGMPHDLLIHYIGSEIKEAQSCQTLPFTLVFLAAYTLMVVVHDPIVHINAVEDSIVHDIIENANFAYTSDYIGHKNIFDVHSHHDFWSWLIQGYVPLIFQQDVQWSEGLNQDDPVIQAKIANVPQPERGVLLHFNRIIGGIRFRQERQDSGMCDEMNDMVRYYRKPCLGSFSYETMPQMPGAQYTDDPQREFWLYASSDVEESLDILKEKELEGWLDEHTQKVEIALPVYNPDNGVYTIVTANFYFSGGGHIWKKLIPMSTYAQWYSGIISAVLDMVWGSCLLSMIIMEAIGIFRAIRDNRLQQHFTFWILADLFTISFALTLVVYFTFRVLNSAELNRSLADLLTIDGQTLQDKYRAEMSSFVDMLEKEIHTLYIFRLAAGVFPLLMLLKLFKAFAAQARLAIVTDTLLSASVDLLHFLLVFMSIFLTYAVAGVVLFGTEIDNFSTFGRSVVTCFRIMMGDFDWEELISVGRSEAGIWFFTFMIIIVLLMLNMLLAIVMDAYAKQAAKAGDAETLWHEAHQWFVRFQGYRRGTLVPLAAIQTALEKADESIFEEVEELRPDATDSGRLNVRRAGSGRKSSKPNIMGEIAPRVFKLVTAENLFFLLPKMQQRQATELLVEAIEEYHREHREEADVEEILHAVRKVNTSTRILKNAMKKSIEEDTATFSTSPFADLPADTKGTTFMDELKRCRQHLHQTRDWISATECKPAQDTDTAALTNFVTPLDPESNEFSEWGVKQVVDDQESMLAACRDSNISTENDALRVQALGKAVRILKFDAHDNTVRCRVPGVGDIWFGVRALIDPQFTEESPARPAVEQSIADGTENEETAIETDMYKRRAQELEQDLKAGRQTVAEALAAVSELEWRLFRAQEERQKVGNKTQQLKKKVVSLTRENVRLIDEARRQEERLSVVGSSRDEYQDLVKAMVAENQRLRAELRDIRSSTNGHRNHSAGQHHNRSMVGDGEATYTSPVAKRLDSLLKSMEQEDGARPRRGDERHYSPRERVAPRQRDKENGATRSGQNGRDSRERDRHRRNRELDHNQRTQSRERRSSSPEYRI